jgi:hypothetical protein
MNMTMAFDERTNAATKMAFLCQRMSPQCCQPDLSSLHSARNFEQQAFVMVSVCGIGCVCAKVVRTWTMTFELVAGLAKRVKAFDSATACCLVGPPTTADRFVRVVHVISKNLV